MDIKPESSNSRSRASAPRPRGGEPEDFRSIRLSPAQILGALPIELARLPVKLRVHLTGFLGDRWVQTNPRLACAVLRELSTNTALRGLVHECGKEPEKLAWMVAVQAEHSLLLSQLLRAHSPNAPHLQPALVRAVKFGRDRALSMMLAAGAGAHSLTDREKHRTLLHEAVLRGYLRCAILLKEFGAQTFYRDVDGLSPLGIVAAEKGFLAAVQAHIRLVPEAWEVDRSRLISRSLQIAREIEKQVERFRRQNLKDALVNLQELARLIDYPDLPRHLPFALKYLAFSQELMNPHIEPRDHHLVAMLPDLLHFYPSYAITERIHHVDQVYDREKVASRRFVYNGEFALLLNRTGSDTNREDLQQQLVYALTSVQDYERNGIKTLPPETQANWAELSCLGYSFGFWRYDTRRGEPNALTPSLFERFGFEFEGGRQTDRSASPGEPRGFGSGYILWPESRPAFRLPITEKGAGAGAEDGLRYLAYDPRTYIEFRHAYLLVSHPDHGTLIIRNANPKFGRPVLSDFALWAPQGIGSGFSQEQILGLDRKFIFKRFTPVVDRSLNQPNSLIPGHHRALINQLQAVRHQYRAWKFDTNRHSAFEREEAGGGLLLGGHYSPGFPAFVELCSRLAEGSDPTALAFANSSMPAWRFFPFPHRGKNLDRLPLSAEVLKALKYLAENKVQNAELSESGVGSFFNKAGFESEGELILIPGEAKIL